MIPIIETRDILELANGDILTLKIYKFIGLRKGKKVYIQGNLHGAEIVGNFVINKLINYFSNLDNSHLIGEIWLVAFCNPLGGNQRTHFFPTGRYNPFDGKDWNRIFWDYERENEELDFFAESQLHLPINEVRNNYLTQILESFKTQLEQLNKSSFVSYSRYFSYQLQSLCLDANYVIDIHSSSNLAIDYIYGFEGREKSATYWGLDYCIYLKENQYDGQAFDESFIKPWLTLEKSFQRLGKEVIFDVESWTLELGSGMKINQESVIKGFNGIINYLNFKGVLNTLIPSKNEIKFREKRQIQEYFVKEGGMVEILVNLGQLVKKDEPLYKIIKIRTGKIVIIKAENDGIIFDINRQECLNQGEYILTILENNF